MGAQTNPYFVIYSHLSEPFSASQEGRRLCSQNIIINEIMPAIYKFIKDSQTKIIFTTSQTCQVIGLVIEILFAAQRVLWLL